MMGNQWALTSQSQSGHRGKGSTQSEAREKKYKGRDTWSRRTDREAGEEQASGTGTLAWGRVQGEDVWRWKVSGKTGFWDGPQGPAGPVVHAGQALYCRACDSNSDSQQRLQLGRPQAWAVGPAAP